MNSIWSTFGAYVARQLRNGKGVGIPKFGNFTFTSTNVDLGVRLYFFCPLRELKAQLNLPFISCIGNHKPCSEGSAGQGASISGWKRLCFSRSIEGRHCSQPWGTN